MSETVRHDIEQLNALIERTDDSAAGYDEAAEASSKAAFIEMFRTRAAERRDLTVRLQDEVRRLGGQPTADGSALAAVHRVFRSLKHVVAGSDHSVIIEVESCEERLRAAFETVIADRDVSRQVKSVVTEGFASIKAGHDQMRRLKQGLAVQPC